MTGGDPDPDYMSLVRHYEACLATHGATHKGVDWPNEADLFTRFRVMLDVAQHDASGEFSVLDIGCGPGLMLDWLEAEGDTPGRVAYQGLDLSPAMVDAARKSHPEASFRSADILRDPPPPQSVDYAVMNGVLTEKVDLSFEAMEAFATNIIGAAFSAARKGIAFNVMSTFVDWERDDLFHWPYERMAAATRQFTPHLQIRADYGLREYTVYLYRHANS